VLVFVESLRRDAYASRGSAEIQMHCLRDAPLRDFPEA
jgi:hypothetical protein